MRSELSVNATPEVTWNDFFLAVTTCVSFDFSTVEHTWRTRVKGIELFEKKKRKLASCGLRLTLSYCDTNKLKLVSTFNMFLATT